MVATDEKVDFKAMRRASMVLNIQALQTNDWLRIICLILACANVYQAMHYGNLIGQLTQRIYVVRTYENGDAHVQRVNAYDFTPDEANLRAWLKTAVEKHYSRVRATVEKDWTESLTFFAKTLQQADIEDAIRTQWRSALIGGGPQYRAEVKMISLDPLTSTPYRGIVFYDMVKLSDTGEEQSRERNSVSLVFTMKPTGSNPNLAVNPLNLQIVDRHADKAE